MKITQMPLIIYVTNILSLQLNSLLFVTPDESMQNNNIILF